MSGSTIENISLPQQAENEPFTIEPIEIELDDDSVLSINERAATIEIKFKITNPNHSLECLAFLLNKYKTKRLIDFLD